MVAVIGERHAELLVEESAEMCGAECTFGGEGVAVPVFRVLMYAATGVVDGGVDAVMALWRGSREGVPEACACPWNGAVCPLGAVIGALFRMGVYCVSKIVAAMGTARRVMAHLSTVDKPTALDDGATIMIEFEGGVLGTAVTSWCDPARSGFLHIHGTEGKLWSTGTTGSELELIKPSSYADEHAHQITETVTLRAEENQHAEWLRCIRTQSHPAISNIYFARHIIEILLAALTSHKQGVWVDLETLPYRDECKMKK